MPSSFPSIGNVSCIAMEGADARRFAQAQFSGDVDALAQGHWQWNAWLTAQGRIRALMHLVDPGDGTLLAVLRGGDAEATRAAMARYLLRMRATLTVRAFTGCAAGPAPEETVRIDTDGAIVLGYGVRSLRLESAAAAPDSSVHVAWRLAEIRQGWPNLPQGEPEFLPPALGLEHLGGVAFDKGCYPGQEIAARLHYRRGHKYRLCHMRGTQPLSRGPIRDAGGAVTAWVLDAVAGEGDVEALVVAPIEIESYINDLDNNHSVVSRFDA